MFIKFLAEIWNTAVFFHKIDKFNPNLKKKIETTNYQGDWTFPVNK